MLAEPKEYRDALEGRFGQAPTTLWAWPIHALRSAFDRSLSVSPADAANLEETIALRAAQHALLAHFVDGDHLAVGEWVAFLRSIASDEAEHLARLGSAWSALLLDEGNVSLNATIEFARAQKRPALRVEALCAATLLVVREDASQATDMARKAVRIARTEEMIQQEYLANVVLARCRRREGRPYLAARILTELRRVSCGRWRSWIEWENQLADPFAVTEVARAMPLRSVRDGCLQGRREMLSASLAMARCPADRSEVDRLQRGLDPVREAFPVELAFQGWQTDREPDEPYGRWILVDPVAGSREISALSLALSDQQGYARCPILGSGQVRAAQVLAVLASRPGEAIPTPEVFQSVYGFAYVAEKHSTVFRSALKRVRDQLGELGVVDRPSAGTVRLLAAQRLSVPDPQSILTLEERILRILSRTPASSAEIARLLHVSKRQVQKSLPELIAQGCCSVEKDGRAVRYNVEDTTFVVPTFARVQPVFPES